MLKERLACTTAVMFSAVKLPVPVVVVATKRCIVSNWPGWA
jgi:hypothetical protein